MSGRARTWLVAAAVLACAACDGDKVVCGPGTLRVDDVCMPAGTVDDSSCGPGTHLEALTGECLADAPPTVCGDKCMAEDVADDGTVTCVCTLGEPRDGCHCGQGAPACPDPGGEGVVSICGQLYDASTGQPLVTDSWSAAACDPDNPTTEGPCALQLALYDPLALAGDPTTAQPQAVDYVEVNDCGWFKAIKVEVPFSGMIAVVVDDAGDDAHVRSATILTVGNVRRLTGVPALVLSHDADAAWTAAAGDPFGGDTLAQRGVAMTRLVSAGAPVADAQLTCGGEPAAAYYFSDLARWSAATVDPARDRTGVNGAALWNTSCLSSGIDSGLDATCEWPGRAAGPIPGLFVSEELTAHVAGDPTTPCP